MALTRAPQEYGNSHLRLTPVGTLSMAMAMAMAMRACFARRAPGARITGPAARRPVATRQAISPVLPGLPRVRLGAIALATMLLAMPGSPRAGQLDDVGYTALKAQLGAALPTGRGVEVQQVEATQMRDHDGDPTTPELPTWIPDRQHPQLDHVEIRDLSGGRRTAPSNHATSVARRFYGDVQSLAPGIRVAYVRAAEDWLGPSGLRTGMIGLPPLPAPGKVTNHSWIGQPDKAGHVLDVLMRSDWQADADDVLVVCGVRNQSPNLAFLSSMFNAIAVGRTDLVHGLGSPEVSEDYTAGRTRPELVAPATSTSSATPLVSSAGALLIQAANGDGRRPETLRAVLLAGASRVTANTYTADIVGYRLATEDQTDNGLDRRYGAGQLNILNSHQILSGGQQQSLEDQPGAGGAIASSGFDYDADFGGAGGSNPAATYFLTAPPDGGYLAAALVWHARIGTEGGYSPEFALYNLDLTLERIDGLVQTIARSASDGQNTENIWVALDGGAHYRLSVSAARGQQPFQWDYALAWRVDTGTP